MYDKDNYPNNKRAAIEITVLRLSSSAAETQMIRFNGKS